MKNKRRKNLVGHWVLMISLSMAVVLSGCGKNEAGAGSGTKGADGKTANTASAAQAENLPEAVKQRGKLRVGVKVDYPPLGYLDETGKNAGYEIGVVQKMAEYAFGDKNAVEFVPVNATNRIPYLDSNKIDFIAATLGVTEERKKQLDFSTTFFDGGVVTVVKKDSGINAISDLAGKKVIVIKGSTGSTYLDENVPTAEQIKIESNADAFRALKDGRADAMFHDAVLMSEFVKTSTDYTHDCRGAGGLCADGDRRSQRRRGHAETGERLA